MAFKHEEPAVLRLADGRGRLATVPDHDPVVVVVQLEDCAEYRDDHWEAVRRLLTADLVRRLLDWRGRRVVMEAVTGEGENALDDAAFEDAEYFGCAPLRPAGRQSESGPASVVVAGEARLDVHGSLPEPVLAAIPGAARMESSGRPVAWMGPPTTTRRRAGPLRKRVHWMSAPDGGSDWLSLDAQEVASQRLLDLRLAVLEWSTTAVHEAEIETSGVVAYVDAVVELLEEGLQTAKAIGMVDGLKDDQRLSPSEKLTVVTQLEPLLGIDPFAEVRDAELAQEAHRWLSRLLAAYERSQATSDSSNAQDDLNTLIREIQRLQPRLLGEFIRVAAQKVHLAKGG